MLRRSIAHLGIALTLAAVSTVAVWNARAADNTSPAAGPNAAARELAAKQQFLKQQWGEFSKNLLLVAQRLEKSEKNEDKDKAKALRKALELAEKEGVDNRFAVLLQTLSKSGDVPLTELKQAADQNAELATVMRQIIDILINNDDLARIREEKERLTKILNELKAILKEQKINLSLTETNRGDPKKLSNEQKDLANKTDNLAGKMGAKGDPKGGDGKETPKGTEKPEGENKSQGKGEDKKDTGDPKGNEKKPTDAKPSESGGGKPSPPKDGSESSSSKPGPPKDGDGDSKPKGSEPKEQPNKENKPAETKNPSDNKGEQKPGDKGNDSQAKGKPSDSPPSQSPPSQAKGGGQPKPGGGQPPPSGQQPPPQQAPGAEQVKKAVPDQEDASQQLEQQKRDDAAKKQEEAIEKLAQAQKELEKRLKQLREEELERLLANLEGRVARMLAMQREVYENTKAIDAQVQKNADKKPSKAEFQKSQTQSDREGEIIGEADRAIDLLKSEGSAVAFPQVFEEVRKDMQRVKERLNKAIVDGDTQMIEVDIIKALEEMLAALKKAQQDLKNSQQSPPGQSGEPPPQKLLDEIAELKMIKALQVRVNERTTKYGQRYKGEQADEEQIKSELRDLGERQEKIESMVKDIVLGKNK